MWRLDCGWRWNESFGVTILQSNRKKSLHSTEFEWTACESGMVRPAFRPFLFSNQNQSKDVTQVHPNRLLWWFFFSFFPILFLLWLDRKSTRVHFRSGGQRARLLCKWTRPPANETMARPEFRAFISKKKNEQRSYGKAVCIGDQRIYWDEITVLLFWSFEAKMKLVGVLWRSNEIEKRNHFGRTWTRVSGRARK